MEGLPIDKMKIIIPNVCRLVTQLLYVIHTGWDKGTPLPRANITRVQHPGKNLNNNRQAFAKLFATSLLYVVLHNFC